MSPALRLFLENSGRPRFLETFTFPLCARRSVTWCDRVDLRKMKLLGLPLPPSWPQAARSQSSSAYPWSWWCFGWLSWSNPSVFSSTVLFACCEGWAFWPTPLYCRTKESYSWTDPPILVLLLWAFRIRRLYLWLAGWAVLSLPLISRIQLLFTWPAGWSSWFPPSAGRTPQLCPCNDSQASDFES